MNYETTKIEGLRIYTLKKFPDERGIFYESYREERYDLPPFVQHNISHSTKNLIRGLHYQVSPFAQGKLISVIQGEIFDVAVDLRKDSPTYGQHVIVVLSDENNKQLWIPPGFAHGFLVLSDSAIVQYKCTAQYHPESERGIVWNDPTLNIQWGVENPQVSQRDQEFPPFT